MTTTTSPTVATVRWHVIGWRESVYQPAPGMPYRAGSSCQKCGQGIRYVVTVKSTNGDVVEVGQDCAVTLQGGPELAEIRRAEREYEHAQWLQSDEYKAQQARDEARRAAVADRAARAEQDFALTLHGLRLIQACGAVTEWVKGYAKAAEGLILRGADGAGEFDDKQIDVFTEALATVFRPAPKHFDAAVGTRVRNVPVEYIRCVSFESDYGRVYIETFATDDGSILVWKGKGFMLEYCLRPKIGNKYLLTGTVKSHGEYRGQPQTKVTRCKIVES
jgi:hypothetical protein